MPRRKKHTVTYEDFYRYEHDQVIASHSDIRSIHRKALVVALFIGSESPVLSYKVLVDGLVLKEFTELKSAIELYSSLDEYKPIDLGAYQ